MKRTKQQSWIAAVGLLGLLVGTAACAAPDRAGGNADADATVLTFAQPNEGAPQAQLVAWAEEVDRLSGGSVRIEFKNGWRIGEPDFESGTIADVQEGDVDMAWVGARAFDRIGVTSFQALLAPMLVDSHDIQAKVFEEGIPQEMLAGLGQIDVMGVGVLPGPMRKVLGVERAFTTPGDFSGAVVGMQDSAVAERSFAVLGASTKSLPSGASINGVDAYEQQLSSIWGNHYELSAGFVTSNLNPWPRPLVMFIGRTAYDGLSESQQRALTSATDQAMLTALDAARAEDSEFVADLCHAGLEFTAASLDQLGSLELAWQQVYDELGTDSETGKWIDRIKVLKETLGAGPDTAECPEDDAATPVAGSQDLPNGTYEMTLTPDDIRAGCKPGDLGAENLEPLTEFEQTLFVNTVKDGTITQFSYYGGRDGERDFGWGGSFRTFRDTFELTDDEGGVLPATWSFDGKQLVLSDMRTEWCDNKTVWTTHPWVLVTVTPAASSGASSASSLEGTWTTTVTEEDWATAGLSNLSDQAGVFTLTFANGLVTLTQPDGVMGYRAKYKAFRDRLETSGHEDVLTATWSVTGDTLSMSGINSGGCTDCEPYAVVWGTHPWTRQ